MTKRKVKVESGASISYIEDLKKTAKARRERKFPHYVDSWEREVELMRLSLKDIKDVVRFLDKTYGKDKTAQLQSIDAGFLCKSLGMELSLENIEFLVSETADVVANGAEKVYEISGVQQQIIDLKTGLAFSLVETHE